MRVDLLSSSCVDFESSPTRLYSRLGLQRPTWTPHCPHRLGLYKVKMYWTGQRYEQCLYTLFLIVDRRMALCHTRQEYAVRKDTQDMVEIATHDARCQTKAT